MKKVIIKSLVKTILLATIGYPLFYLLTFLDYGVLDSNHWWLVLIADIVASPFVFLSFLYHEGVIGKKNKHRDSQVDHGDDGQDHKKD